MASGFSACDCPPCRPGRAGTATGTCRVARVRRTMSRVSSPLAYPQVLRNLARLVTQQISLGDSKALIRRRLATREERFLRFVARYIYGSPRSPYLPLLVHAGAELGDLQTMVRQRGLEGTLERLRDEGVYFSFEEFKGRIDVVRGGRTHRFSERDFDNPFQGPTLEIRTGATRSLGSRVGVALEFIAEQRAPSYHVMLDAIGAAQTPLLIWFPRFPSGAGIPARPGPAETGPPPPPPGGPGVGRGGRRGGGSRCGPCPPSSARSR